MSPRLAFAIDAAYRAGRATLAHFNTGTGFERKEDQTPVTVADRLAERCIREDIELNFPGDYILGEEEGGEDHPDRWVIDPIDGTKSFVCGVPLYATLLSYEQSGVPVVGVCYFPALDEMLYAEKGEGAFWNGRRCSVSQVRDMKDASFSSGGHGSMARFGRNAGFDELARQVLATRTWSDAYGHALVATGRIEGMVDPVVSRWDISAMTLIVPEAGGVCTRFDGGDPLSPAHANGEYELVSSNGLLHDELLKVWR